MFVILLIFVLAILVYKLYKTYTYWTSKGVKNAGYRYWFTVLAENILRVSEDCYVFKEIYNKFKMDRYVGFYNFHLPILLIRDPDLIKQICMDDYKSFSSHSHFVMSGTEPMWNRNLLFLNHDEWLQCRKAMNQGFVGNKLHDAVTYTHQYSNKIMKFLKNKLINKEQEFNAKSVFRPVCHDIVAAVAFGVDCDTLNGDNEFYQMSNQTILLPAISNVQKYLHFLFPTLAKALNIKLISNTAATFFRNYVKSRLSSQDNISNSVLDLLANLNTEENSKNDIKWKLTVDEMIAQILIIMFAALDGMTITLSYVCFYLSINPDMQEKVHNEVVRNLNDSGNLNLDNIKSMKYLDNIIYEILRVHPASTVIDRMCTKPYVIQPKNSSEIPLHIEKGTWVWMLYKDIHCDEKYFPNATKFDPERFNDDNKHTIKRYSHLPFGAGLKICPGKNIGMVQLKIMIANLIQTFEFVPSSKTKLCIEHGETKEYPMVKDIWLGLKFRLNKRFEKYD